MSFSGGTMRNVIGICGLIGSGKGTVADHLVKNDYKKISFADKLKDGVSTIFGWDRLLLEGDTRESREWREVPDEFWTKELGKDITPRLVLQLFGTDCMRNGFDDNIWVNLVKKEILDNPQQNYVIPDVRFPNEINAVKDLNGEVWQVRRGELPLWWATAKNVNQNWDTCKDTNHSMKVIFSEVHQSEWRWVDDDNKFDRIIENNATIENLIEHITSVISH